MKFSLFKNDKSTKADEAILAVFIVACIAIGLCFYIEAPSLWFITSGMTKSLGVLGIITGIVFIPALIYRLCTNEC